MLNRVRQENESGTPSRTLADIVENEGNKINEYIKNKAIATFEEYEFDSKGDPSDTSRKYGTKIAYAKTDTNTVRTAVEAYNKEQEDDDLKLDVSQSNGFYEKKSSTVNISIDDVGVKKQIEHREKMKKKN